MHGLQACLFKYITVAAVSIYLSVVKMPLKGEDGGHALKSLGNYIVDHGKSWKNHGIVFLIFCGNPANKLPMLMTSQSHYCSLVYALCRSEMLLISIL